MRRQTSRPSMSGSIRSSTSASKGSRASQRHALDAVRRGGHGEAPPRRDSFSPSRRAAGRPRSAVSVRSRRSVYHRFQRGPPSGGGWQPVGKLAPLLGVRISPMSPIAWATALEKASASVSLLGSEALDRGAVDGLLGPAGRARWRLRTALSRIGRMSRTAPRPRCGASPAVRWSRRSRWRRGGPCSRRDPRSGPDRARPAHRSQQSGHANGPA